MKLCAVFAAFALLLSLAGCDDDDGPDLDRDVVTELPEGNASGNDTSGFYSLELYTSDCSGSCGPVGYFPFSFSLCDVGDEDRTTVRIKQIDGYLEIKDLQGYIVTRLYGGINGDGSFDVGGYGTEHGGEVESTARATGRITGRGEITGDAHSHTEGSYDDDHVDCKATYRITGNKL